MTVETINVWHFFRICTLFTLGFVSLTVVGYQSLLPILLDNGVFNSYCSSNECNTQSLILSWMFESAISVANISCLFWGSLCLKYNRRKLMTSGSVLCIISCILFAFGSDWIKFFSFILLAFGETGLLFPAFVIPLEYDVKYQGFIFSILIGGVDCGAIMFYFFQLIYDNSNTSLSMLFSILAMIYFIEVFLGPMFLFSKKLFSDSISIESIDDDTYDPEATEEEKMALKKNENYANLNDDDDDDDDESNNDNEVVDDSLLTMLSVIMKRLSNDMLFWMIVVWSGFYVNTKYFYIATLNQQLKWITDNNTSLINTAITVFDILLPCACLFSPFSGTITNKLGLSFSVCLLGLISFIAAITSVITMYYLQYFTMILIVFNRFLFFVIAPMIVGNIYGMKEQTTIYGIILCIAAIYNYISYLWDYICVDVLNYNFTIINLFLGTSCFIASLCTAYLIQNRLICKSE